MWTGDEFGQTGSKTNGFPDGGRFFSGSQPANLPINFSLNCNAVVTFYDLWNVSGMVREARGITGTLQVLLTRSCGPTGFSDW